MTLFNFSSSRDWMPKTIREVLAFVTHFDGQVGVDPVRIGITPAVSEAYHREVVDFGQLVTAAEGTTTRTPYAIKQREEAMTALIETTRRLVRSIQGNLNVTDDDRHRLGIPVRKTHGTPVPVPTDKPDIDVKGVDGRAVRVRIHRNSALRRARPDGVAGAIVFTAIGVEQPADSSGLWTFFANTTRTLFDVIFDDAVPSGTQVWVKVAWFNPTSQLGPFSKPVSAFVAGSDVGVAAGRAGQTDSPMRLAGDKIDKAA